MKQRMLRIASLIILIGFGWMGSASAFQTAGFQQTLVTGGISSPTAMEFAPDGRLFVAEKVGRLRVIKNGVLLPTNFVTLSVTSNSERGLLGIAFDPAFATNRFIYLYYTRTATPVKNRVSRFTASASDPDVVQTNSEVVILDNIASDAGNHNGGAIHFGLDGKLYVAVGDGGSTSSNAQSLSTLSGKLLRINTDGSIPSDNPFVSTSGARGEIWALGLRNPYTFAVDPVSGKIHINDVGQSSFEEVNLGIRGANYGWPTCEGLSCGNNPNFTNPIYTYGRSVGQAITGGAFYRANQFPSQYVGSYFFSDYLGGWIKRLDTNNVATDFWNPQNGPVDLKVGPDGSLYYLSIYDGSVYKIQVTGANQSPTASFTASPTSGAAPLSVGFNASSSSDPDTDTLTYAWDFGDGTAGGTGVTVNHTYQNSGSYTARLTVNDGRGGTATATRAILVGSPPVGSILTPTAGTMYNAGNTIAYSGSANDAEDGPLGANRFSWTIVFHHDVHTHPFLGPINGVTSGSFQIPQTGESSSNTFYRIHLTVTDSTGLTHETTRDVFPRVVTLSLATNIPGLSLTLDGQPVTTPFSFSSVVGFTRTLGAPSPQTVNGQTYTFVSWSDAGSQTHTVNTPAANTTYTANYQNAGTPPPSTWNINFQPAGAPVPAGYLVDSGSVYGARGNGYSYGWNTITDSRDRNNALSPDQRYDTFVIMGNAVWEMAMPNGSYSVHVVVGDAEWPDVVSKLTVEGVTAINGSTNSTARWLEATVTVTVADGRLTVGNLAGSYNKICFIDISTSGTPPPPPPGSTANINFQPAGSPAYPGYLVDSGSVYGVRSNGYTYGWSAAVETRDRDSTLSPDQRYDTLAVMGNSVWEMAVPNGSYTVRVVVGDADWNDVISKLTVEGVMAIDGNTNGASRWLEATVTVTVNDGRLTVGNLAGSYNKICFIDISTSGTPPPPPSSTANINFQPAGSPAYPGYLVDSGLVYGSRGNGFSYGWTTAVATRDRDSTLSPDQRYDTLAVMGNSVWEIAVPNGSYTVRVVVGDADWNDVISKLTVEGVMAINGNNNGASRWLEATLTVTVSDGKLTLSNLAGSYNKICFIDISSQP